MNREGEITGRKDAQTQTLYLQGFLPQVENHYAELSCSRWAALMSAKLYVLISWPDGSRVISMENIKEPRKPFHLYAVGEQVLARCPGFSGLYWGIVEGISGE